MAGRRASMEPALEAPAINAVWRVSSDPRSTVQPPFHMRDDQKQERSTPMDSTRRVEPPPTGRHARHLDCGGSDGTSARPRLWPAARALGTPRDGESEAPDAA